MKLAREVVGFTARADRQGGLAEGAATEDQGSALTHSESPLPHAPMAHARRHMLGGVLDAAGLVVEEEVGLERARDGFDKQLAQRTLTKL